MRKKEWKVVITFATTTMAIHMEQYCKANHIPGRLIPVPSAITAGCGLAWVVYPKEKEEVLMKMKKEKIAAEGIYELEI